MLTLRFKPMRSLYARFLLALVLSGIVPLGLVGLTIALLESRVISQQSARELTGLARGLGGQIEFFLNGALEDTRAIAALPEIVSMDPRRQGPLLKELFHHHSEYARLSTFDRTGRRLASSHPGGAPSIGMRSSFQAALRSGHQRWEIAHALSTGRSSFLVHTPIRDAERRVVGALGAVVDLQNLSAILNNVRVGGGGQTFVLDGDGRVLLHPDLAAVEERRDYSPLGMPAGGRPTGAGTIKYERDGEAFTAGYAAVPNIGWTVVVEQPQIAILLPAKKSVQLALAGLIISTFLALLAGVFFTRKLTHPVSELAAAARALAAGEPSRPLPPASKHKTEIDILVEAFDAMRQAVVAREELLKARFYELEAVHQINQAVLESSDLKTTLEAILDKAFLIGPFDLGVIRFVDQGRKIFKTAAHRGYRRPEEIAQVRPVSAENQTGARIESETLFRQGICVVVDVPGSVGLRTFKKEGVQSAVAIPVRAKGDVLGITLLGSRTSRNFSPEQIRVLEALGDQVGIALQKARLFEESQRLAQEQAVLAAVATATSQSLEVRAVLEIALDKTLEVLRRDIGFVRLKDEHSGYLELIAYRGISESYVAALKSEKRGGPIARKVLDTGEPTVVDDLSSDEVLQATWEEGVRSAMWVPVGTKGKVLGVLAVASKGMQPFDERDLDLLKAVGNTVGTSVANAGLFEETRRRAREQELLNALARATSQSLQLKELLQVAVDKVREVTGRERTSIRLRDPATGKVELAVHKGLSGEEEKALRRVTSHRMSEQVFASGQPVVVNDVEGKGTPEIPLRQTRSVAWVPIKARDEVSGVLGVSSDSLRPFAPEEVDLLVAIGNVIGVAVDNARLFEATKRNLDRIRALQEIDQAITSTLDLGSVLEVLLEKIDLLLPYSVATVRLFNKESGLLEPVACRNLDEKKWKAEQWRGGRGIPNVAFETKSPIMIGNVQTDPRTKDPEFFREHGLVSYLGVPLIVKDEVLGVLSFYTKEEREFSKDEREFLTTLAGQAAVAIHNSQLYEEMTKLAADLAKSNKVKDEFLSVMSHELRTPLNVIMGYAGMIGDGMFGEVNCEQRKAAERILGRAKEQLTMISGILEVTQIEAEKVKVERDEVHLADFLDDLKSGYQVSLDRAVTVSWDYFADLPVVMTDSDKLKHILQNLINNAIKFTEKGSVTVSARVKEEATGTSQQFIEVKVADTGIGIPEEALPFIFEKFRQLDSSETRAYGGVGLGLYIVNKYVELLGGKVEVESEVGEGSTFTVKIPCEIEPAAEKGTGLQSRRSVADSGESI